LEKDIILIQHWFRPAKVDNHRTLQRVAGICKFMTQQAAGDRDGWRSAICAAQLPTVQDSTCRRRLFGDFYFHSVASRPWARSGHGPTFGYDRSGQRPDLSNQHTTMTANLMMDIMSSNSDREVSSCGFCAVKIIVSIQYGLLRKLTEALHEWIIIISYSPRPPLYTRVPALAMCPPNEIPRLARPLT